MANIFEELDKLINSVNEAEEPVAEEEAPVKKSRPIPINPEMETKEQGEEKAYEKFAKYFYDLSVSSGGDDGKMKSKDEIDLPDDFLDPILKGKLKGKIQDKDFERNKVLWDPEELEKLEKEVNIDIDGGSEEDEFDDFDYRQNEFGDDDDSPNTDDLDTSEADSSGGSSSSSSKSEKDKLQDAINKAIDKIRDAKQQSGEDSGSQSGSQSGSDSGSSSGSDSGSDSGSSSSGGESGSESKGSSSSGGESSSSAGSDSGSSSSGPTTGGDPGSSSSGTGSRDLTAKDKKLSDLKDALERGDSSGFGEAVDDLKEGETGSGKLAGEHSDKVSDDAFRKDMKDAGFSDEEISDMTKIKDTDTTEEESKEEMEELKRKVVDGLEKKCKKRGGSALAKTVVKNALRSKIDNEEWREMLKMFLKMKSINKGDHTKAKNKTMWGHKNHLWRGAVLPTRTQGKGEVQRIYCFVDFSGSVDQDLVYTFLGRVIDLCEELAYTNVTVYGFGDKIVLPREINGKMLKKDGKGVVLSQTWDYINSQHPGSGSENFEDVSLAINEIRKKDRTPVFLIFGDALWSCYNNPHKPIFLKDNCPEKVLDDVCVLAYYMEANSTFAGEIAYLKELVGLKHIITTKATSIHTGE